MIDIIIKICRGWDMQETMETANLVLANQISKVYMYKWYMSGAGMLVLHLQHWHPLWMPTLVLAAPTSNPTPCLQFGKQCKMTQALGPLQLCGRPERSCWLLTSNIG